MCFSNQALNQQKKLPKVPTGHAPLCVNQLGKCAWNLRDCTEKVVTLWEVDFFVFLGMAKMKL